MNNIKCDACKKESATRIVDGESRCDNCKKIKKSGITILLLLVLIGLQIFCLVKLLQK